MPKIERTEARLYPEEADKYMSGGALVMYNHACSGGRISRTRLVIALRLESLT